MSDQISTPIAIAGFLILLLTGFYCVFKSLCKNCRNRNQETSQLAVNATATNEASRLNPLQHTNSSRIRNFNKVNKVKHEPQLEIDIEGQVYKPSLNSPTTKLKNCAEVVIFMV